jgi:hypothetical protein
VTTQRTLSFQPTSRALSCSSSISSAVTPEPAAQSLLHRASCRMYVRAGLGLAWQVQRRAIIGAADKRPRDARHGCSTQREGGAATAKLHCAVHVRSRTVASRNKHTSATQIQRCTCRGATGYCRYTTLRLRFATLKLLWLAEWRSDPKAKGNKKVIFLLQSRELNPGPSRDRRRY